MEGSDFKDSAQFEGINDELDQYLENIVFENVEESGNNVESVGVVKKSRIDKRNLDLDKKEFIAAAHLITQKGILRWL